MKSHWMQIKEDGAVLEIREVSVPEPGPTQVLVRVHAAGLNRGEFILGHGLHGKPGAAKAVGMEAAGEVVSCGGEVQTLKTGQRVMGRCASAFSEFALMDVREAMVIPEVLSDEEAASIPLTFLVVYDILVQQGRLQAGEWVLIAGASSGVGVAALQAAKAMGAKVIGTSGSQQKLNKLQSMGMDIGVCTRTPDFLAPVMQATDNKGVNLVVNTVGGSVFAECIKAMAFEARLATVGYVDGVLKAEMDIEALHAKRLTLYGVSNKLRNPEQRAQGVPGFKKDFLPYFESGRIKPVVDKIFPFDQLEEARQYMESNLHLGKIVLQTSAS